MISAIGITACLLTILMVGAQFLKTLRSGKTRDLSSASLVFSVLEVGLWAAYATMTEDLPLFIAGWLSVMMYGAILYIKITNWEDDKNEGRKAKR